MGGEIAGWGCELKDNGGSGTGEAMAAAALSLAPIALSAPS